MSPRSQFGRSTRNRHTVGGPQQHLQLAETPTYSAAVLSEKSLVNDVTVGVKNSNAFLAAPQTFGLDARPAMPAMQDNPRRRGSGGAGSLRHSMDSYSGARDRGGLIALRAAESPERTISEGRGGAP